MINGARPAAAATLLAVLSSCGGPSQLSSGGATSPPAQGEPRIDPYLEKACQLVDLPTGTQEERTEVGKRAADILMSGPTVGPRSDVPFLVLSLTTLAKLPEGQRDFPSGWPRPTVGGTYVPPATLEEGLATLQSKCETKVDQ